MKAFILVLAVIIASGCINVKSDYYCGCPEFKLKGTIKDFNINIDNGFLVTTKYCHVTLDNGEKIFIEGGVCEEMKYNWNLYQSVNRDTFYAVCNPASVYDVRDKCEYEIEDINDATEDALGMNKSK